MKKVRSTIVCALVGFGSVAGALSETIQVRDAPGGETSFGTPNGYFLEGTASGGDPIGTPDNSDDIILYDGAFSLQIQHEGSDEWESLITYCIEPTQGIQFGTNPDDLVGLPYQTAALTDVDGITDQEAVWIEVLYANAFDDTLTGPDTYTTSVKASAFQTIIWELKQDDTFQLTGFGPPTNNFRLDTGWSFTADVVDLANQWFDNIQSGQWVERQPLVALTSDISQDLILPVPEPASGLMLVLGLGIACWRRR